MQSSSFAKKSTWQSKANLMISLSNTSQPINIRLTCRASSAFALKRFLLICALIVSATLGLASPVNARKAKNTHVVKSGESIAKIADFYSVSQRDLRELNKLSRTKPLRLGQKLNIPNVLRVSGKTYKVKKGDTLASIGQKYKRSPRDIAHANKIKTDAALSLGRLLVIPDKNASATTYKSTNGTPARVLFLRVRTGEREKLQLYHKSGKINKKATQRLSYLARDKKGNKVKRLNTRLIYLLQRIAEHFEGKAIEIISGYRAQSTGNESQHAFGRAMDFRISGVSGKKIFQFCKKLTRAGCGYYPNDGFVHVDAREKKTFWIGK